jgi:hypothetical protein
VLFFFTLTYFFAGIWCMACSAIAVMDKDGFTPGFAEIIDPSIT